MSLTVYSHIQTCQPARFSWETLAFHCPLLVSIRGDNSSVFFLIYVTFFTLYPCFCKWKWSGDGDKKQIPFHVLDVLEEPTVQRHIQKTSNVYSSGELQSKWSCKDVTWTSLVRVEKTSVKDKIRRVLVPHWTSFQLRKTLWLDVIGNVFAQREEFPSWGNLSEGKPNISFCCCFALKANAMFVFPQLALKIIIFIFITIKTRVCSVAVKTTAPVVVLLIK